MSKMFQYGKDQGVGNCEGWKLSDTYNPEKDLSVRKDKFYVLQNPDPTKANHYVLKELGYIGKDGCFHYYHRYQED